ncbi:MAG: dihydrolipoyllysine-residue succinyltransferase, partial [Proteiniphilum sp.]|nr:dihydrolipoyllysine-residue succinyltransferase [Proteiniphilum sp.]
MALIEIKIPSPGESITHVELFHWLVEDGAIVRKNSEIAELESDKATLMLVADETGKISFNASEGDMLEVGTVACSIDTSVQPEESGAAEDKADVPAKQKREEQPSMTGLASAEAPGAASQTTDEKKPAATDKPESAAFDKVKITPLAKKVMEANDLSVDDVISGLRRLKREDVEASMLAEKGDVGGGLKKPVSRGAS